MIEAIDLLGGVAGVTPPPGVTDLSKSSVHDHSDTLADRGYVVRADGTPDLSYRVLRIALAPKR